MSIFPLLLALCAAYAAPLALSVTSAAAQQSCPGADSAARRVALVIGIEDYTHVRKLNNPVRDATAIADLLCRHGIQPTLLKNPTHAELLIAADRFESDATGADLALVYYAGHGMNLQGEDVVLPKDLPQRCEPETPAEAQRGTLRVERLVATMRGAKNRVALFDACRTTTFPSCPGRGDGDTTFRGLGRIAEQGALIATSTSRGSVAADGLAGRHSPYAELLLKHFTARPAGYFHDVLFDVNRDLLALPGGQRPELLLPSGGVPPQACLAGKDCGGAEPGSKSATEARLAYSRVETSMNPDEIRAWQQQFGTANPFYNQQATSRLATLAEFERRRLADMAATAASTNSPLTGFQPAEEATDIALQAAPLWKTLKRVFPDWYAERLTEASAMARNKKSDADIGGQMMAQIMALRRKHAGDALSATPAQLKSIAVGFAETFVRLRKVDVAACHGFITSGETHPAYLNALANPAHTGALQAQISAVFEAAAEGRKVPRVHPKPVQRDYTIVVGLLEKRGWSNADMRLFSDSSGFAKAEPEKMCKMVIDWFEAQLEITDADAQMRLISDALKPVVSG